eukprot:7451016-Pyramimonas_sp.AAC.1
MGTDPGHGENLTSGGRALYQRGKVSLPRAATSVTRLEDVHPRLLCWRGNALGVWPGPLPPTIVPLGDSPFLPDWRGGPGRGYASVLFRDLLAR